MSLLPHSGLGRETPTEPNPWVEYLDLVFKCAIFPLVKLSATANKDMEKANHLRKKDTESEVLRVCRVLLMSSANRTFDGLRQRLSLYLAHDPSRQLVCQRWMDQPSKPYKTFSKLSHHNPLTSTQTSTSRLVLDHLWQLWQSWQTLWLNQLLSALRVRSEVVPYRPAGR